MYREHPLERLLIHVNFRDSPAQASSRIKALLRGSDREASKVKVRIREASKVKVRIREARTSRTKRVVPVARLCRLHLLSLRWRSAAGRKSHSLRPGRRWDRLKLLRLLDRTRLRIRPAANLQLAGPQNGLKSSRTVARQSSVARTRLKGFQASGRRGRSCRMSFRMSYPAYRRRTLSHPSRAQVRVPAR